MTIAHYHASSTDRCEVDGGDDPATESGEGSESKFHTVAPTNLVRESQCSLTTEYYHHEESSQEGADQNWVMTTSFELSKK